MGGKLEDDVNGDYYFSSCSYAVRACMSHHKEMHS